MPAKLLSSRSRARWAVTSCSSTIVDRSSAVPSGWAETSRIRAVPSLPTAHLEGPGADGGPRRPSSASRSVSSSSSRPSAAARPKSSDPGAGRAGGDGAAEQLPRGRVVHRDPGVVDDDARRRSSSRRPSRASVRWRSDSAPLWSSSAISAPRCSRIRVSSSMKAVLAMTSRSMIDAAGSSPA